MAHFTFFSALGYHLFTDGIIHFRAFQVDQWVKNLPVVQEMQVREDPWRVWQPTPIFLPGESHRQRSLAGYSP